MSLFDDTAADAPVRDIALNVPRLALDTSGVMNARVRQDVLKMSREELEDKFLRLNDENLNLKQHMNKQEEKMKRLATKLMRLVKDRNRLEQLASGGMPQPRFRGRDLEMEELVENLQDNNRSLQNENQALKQRLHVAKQQVMHQQNRRTAAYNHIHSRINSGLKKLRDSPSPPPVRPKSARSVDTAGRPPSGQLPRYGHNLLEEARAEIRNLENEIESERRHMEALEGEVQMLRDELKKKEAEFEERLLDVRQQQTSNLRTHVNSNVNMIKLQKQLADRSNAVNVLEGRFLQLQESQQRLKVTHDSALSKVDSLSLELKDERLRSFELEKQLQTSAVSNAALKQLQEQISELEQERDLLKDNNKQLVDSVSSAFDVSQQHKWQIQEQKLKLQISQLETALQADLVDKNEILDKIKAERENSEKLSEENKKLHIQWLEQKQQLDEMKDQFRVYSKDSDYNVSELTEALLLVQKRKAQNSGVLDFLTPFSDEVKLELRAAHAETIQELEKTRALLSVESQICRGYKAELDTVSLKLKNERLELDQRLEAQARILDSRAARIKKLEGQLKDIAYGTKAYVFKPDEAKEEDDCGDSFNESLLLERGENVLELQICSVSFSPSALESLSDPEPSTFCTYALHSSDLHSTPVVSGRCPRYGFTSRYVVRVDPDFLEYVSRGAVAVELHQSWGLDWTTLAAGQIRLQPLMEQEGKVHGTVPLIGECDEALSFGSLDYWLRLRIPMTQTLLLYKERLKAVDYVSSEHPEPPLSDDWNQLCVSVHSCRDLASTGSAPPSPYVVYRFFSCPDYPSETVHASRHPLFNDSKLYSVLMDPALHRYLCSELMHFYVFDYNQEQMDVYLGKAKVPLKPLVQNEAVTGDFKLFDQSGLPAGHIQLSLKWNHTYLPPPGSEVTEEGSGVTEERSEAVEEEPRESEHRQIEEETGEQPKPPEPPELQTEDTPKTKSREAPGAMVHPNVALKAPLPSLRHRTLLRETSKRVTFMETMDPETQPDPEPPPAPSAGKKQEKEDEEEESHVSEGQILASSSLSDDSDQISDPIPMEDSQDFSKMDRTPSSDSDDCVVAGQTTEGKASEHLRVEVVSLSLLPDSRVSQDASVVRLYVEYFLLDGPTAETPVSLPKPTRGHSVNFNFSKVIPIDAETSSSRRSLLRSALQGKNPQMETIQFTVVSEPLEEEQQERECEDVGVAYVRLPEILQRRRDLTEAPLDVLDAQDQSEVIGVLTVSVEALEALESVMKDAQLD